MFMLKLFRFITGYVRFAARGRFLERFLNLCAAAGIVVWSTQIKDGELRGSMRVSDYFKIRPLARRTGVRARVLRRRGLNFILHRYRHRYGIAAGAALFLAVNLLLSSVLWNVNIVGNEQLKAEEILKSLERVGVYEGAFRRSVDAENARLQLLIDNPSLSWAAINIDGSIVTVDVRETVQRAAPQKTERPSNVVATLGGKIVSVRAYFGSVAVSPGEAVAKGDLLVSGAVALKGGATKFVCARAEVMAETERRLSSFVPYLQQKKQLAEPKTRRVISFFGVRLPLFLGEIKQPYEAHREHSIPQFDGVRLPLALYTAEFRSVSYSEYKIDEKTARERAAKQVAELAEQQLGSRLRAAGQPSYTKRADGICCEVVYKCVENIAKTEEIMLE